MKDEITPRQGLQRIEIFFLRSCAQVLFPFSCLHLHSQSTAVHNDTVTQPNAMAAATTMTAASTSDLPIISTGSNTGSITTLDQLYTAYRSDAAALDPTLLRALLTAQQDQDKVSAFILALHGIPSIARYNTITRMLCGWIGLDEHGVHVWTSSASMEPVS